MKTWEETNSKLPIPTKAPTVMCVVGSGSHRCQCECCCAPLLLVLLLLIKHLPQPAPRISQLLTQAGSSLLRLLQPVVVVVCV